MTLQHSRWTIYLDDVSSQDTRGQPCIEKWIGKLDTDEVAILNVRPDGYVGAVEAWSLKGDDSAEASKWLDDYYSGFLAE